ncbi:hypothetical protein [Halorussus aquaticus]|uniref:Uncharacterized protein n=1 Tax=Halorussus aquaticus TaxID=2953748 RepID=A0ABD5Q825_9EURY|nr:hypothetical protein [Halorussus aquaticus]
MGPPDTIAPLTTEHHYTEPIETEHTGFGIDRFYHRVPLDWFLVVSGEIDAWSYEFFLEKGNLFERDYSIVAVDFDYDVDRNSDGTGKPFHVLFCDSEGEERKCYPRTHYLLRLLEYDESIYEVVAVNPTDEYDGVLVAVQERLPHVPDSSVDALEDTDVT